MPSRHRDADLLLNSTALPHTLPYLKGRGFFLLLVPKPLLSPLYTSPSESKYSVSGIQVIPSLMEKEVSRKARKGAKKSEFLYAFASLRETCSLGIVEYFYVLTSITTLVYTMRAAAWEWCF